MKKFVFTCGDINGIGPEIVVKSLNTIFGKDSNNGYYFICPANIFHKATKLVKPRFNFIISTDYHKSEPGMVAVINPGNVKISEGKPTVSSGKCAYEAIELSFALLKNQIADAVITAPVSKNALKLAGVQYPGHTEMFADWCGTSDYAMSFFSPSMNCALSSIHIPIKEISGSLTYRKLKSVLNVLISTLQYDLNIVKPSIAVLGLNPHSGENGLIGNEETKIIDPLIKEDAFKPYCQGPYSADAFFAKREYKNFDMVLGMYHDQVLIPFKMLNFDRGVNYTAGLPVIRTSPDHGTAFDIAWKNAASASSMVDAYKFADKVITNRRKNAGSRKKNL